MSLAITQELKQLRSRLTTAKAELATAVEEVKLAQRRESTARKLISDFEKRIATLESDSEEPVVTEHAILRYLERVRGIDLEEVRKTILNEKTLGLINQFRSGKIPSEGCRLVVKDRVVITVETKK